MNRTFKFVTALALLCFSLTASAGMTLNDLTPGKTVSGPDLTVKDMKGKVVYVVFWGTH